MKNFRNIFSVIPEVSRSETTTSGIHNMCGNAAPCNDWTPAFVGVTKTGKSTPQSGNMLIYILGAIVLMGLLVVALKGSFQEGSGIDPEKNAILVTQVQKYGAELERGVRYILDNGYSETDLRFAHPSADAGYGLITDIPARQVFDPAGGGVEWQSPPAGSQISSLAWFFSGRNYIPGVGSSCAANDCVELIAFLPDVTKEFCLRVNTALGITNPSGNPPTEGSNVQMSTFFAGAFSYSATVDGMPLSAREGCFEGGSGSHAQGWTGHYYYYRVLLAR